MLGSWTGARRRRSLCDVVRLRPVSIEQCDQRGGRGGEHSRVCVGEQAGRFGEDGLGVRYAGN